MHESIKWKWSRSVVPDSSRLLRPWDFLGKSTGVGCHCLLQENYQKYSVFCTHFKWRNNFFDCHSHCNIGIGWVLQKLKFMSQYIYIPLVTQLVSVCLPSRVQLFATPWTVACSQPGFSIHGIFQARILEWVAISSSRGSSQPRDPTRNFCIPCIGRGIL